jgi:hypothetical protein
VKASRLISVTFAAGSCVALYACGGGSNGSSTNMTPTTPPPATVSTQALTTADVLTMAKAKSETASPLAVDGGAVTVDPTGDETSDPVAVDN